jgi:DNA polymerase-3 subunit alpha
MQTATLANVPLLADGLGTRFGGFLANVTVKRRKKDDRAFAILDVEGKVADVECLCFSDTYDRCAPILEPQTAVMIEGHISQREDESAKLLVQDIMPLDEAHRRFTKAIHLHVREETFVPSLADQILRLCERCPGDAGVYLCAICRCGDVGFIKLPLRVRPCRELRNGFIDLLGPEAVRQKTDRTRPERQKRWNGKNAGGNGGRQ